MSPILPDPHHPTSEELFAYRDGELTADRRTLIEAHVMACAQCSERLDEMSAAEAELRLRPDGAGEEYFEHMAELVMRRIAVADREVRAGDSGRVEPAAPGPIAGGRSVGGGYVEVPRIDRRRPDTGGEDLEPRRRLHLPWIGIAGSAAAAVAVMIVAVVLFRGQSEWLRAPRPAVVGEPRSVIRADSMLAKEGGAAGDAARNESAAPPARDRAAARREKASAVKKPDRAMPQTEERAPAPIAGSTWGKLETKDQAERVRSGSGTSSGGGQPAPSAATVPPEAQMDRRLMAAQNAAPGLGAAGEAYGGVLRAYRLPPVWNPSVPSDAVARAENDLRYLYQAGRAGADSARIRLYLAEAERARLTDPSNTAAVESISHHYRRAISLAGGDGTLAATARRRLQEFEQEMTRARGTQP